MTAFLLQIYEKVNDKWNDMCEEKNTEKNSWCELNPRPSVHQLDALTTELLRIQSWAGQLRWNYLLQITIKLL